MKSEDTQGERNSLLFVSLTVVLVLIIGVLASTEVSYVNVLQKGSERPPSFIGMNSVRSNSSNGLSLILSLNTTVVAAGQGILITVGELNTLPRANNVSAGADWPLKDLSLSQCGVVNSPYGMALFHGYYDRSNVSLAKPLELYYPGGRSCPMILSGIDAYGFPPLSDKAVVYGSCEPRSCFTLPMSSEIPLSGFWTGDALYSFDAGVYTVAEGDEWGQMVFLHFQVREAVQGVSSIKLEGFSLCPGNCGYPSPYQLSGYIFFNGTAPLKSLQLFVNGVYGQGVQSYDSNSTSSAILYKNSFQYPEVVRGNVYVLRFIATFRDNSTATATAEVVAG